MFDNIIYAVVIHDQNEGTWEVTYYDSYQEADYYETMISAKNRIWSCKFRIEDHPRTADYFTKNLEANEDILGINKAHEKESNYIFASDRWHPVI